MADWQAIKTEYITTDTSYRKLADKYGVHYKVISDRGKNEGWVELRSQHQAKTLTKTLDKISKQEANRAARIFSVADKLLDKIEFLVDNGEDMLTDKAIRSLTAAVRDLKEIQGVKSKLDQQEQEARIANLRKQAEADEQKEMPTLIIEGLPEEFKV
jgi:hypothetical protein